MNPGYFIGIFITVFLLAEHFLFGKKNSTRKNLIAVIAAIAAGVFAGYLFTWGINIFRTFMQANVGNPKFNDDLVRLSLTAINKFICV